MNYYAQSDMVSIVIPVPKTLKAIIEAKRKNEGITKRNLYIKALRDFVAMHEGHDRRRRSTSKPTTERRQPRRVVYLATYKNIEAPKLRIWVDKPLADIVAELAHRACVSRRAFAYTAICTTFHNQQEITECQEFQ